MLEYALAATGTWQVVVTGTALAMVIVVAIQVIVAHVPQRVYDQGAPVTVRNGAPSAVSELEETEGTSSLRRWHVVAAMCALAPPTLWGTRQLYVALAPTCDDGFPCAFALNWPLWEIGYWFLLASIPVALLYLHRLQSSGVRDAVLFVFAVLATPRILLALIGD